MKKIFYALSIACVLLSSCNFLDEWTPVFTGKYDEPAQFEPYVLPAGKKVYTIQELSATYATGNPKIMGDYYVQGKVISTDQPGNFYKSFYIQDETGGMEIKVGRNSLYSDFHLGQTVYVWCKGLWLGMYGYKDGSYGGQGMVQIGMEDPSGEYETSYIESPYLIDVNILRGELGEPVAPEVVKESDLPTSAQYQKDNRFVGRLVTIENLEYTDQAFVLLYPDSSKPHKNDNPENRVFLSSDNSGKVISNAQNWKIFTWAMSKANIVNHLKKGDWDGAEVGSGGTSFGPITNTVSDNGMFAAEYKGMTYKDLLIKNAAAQSVSQYFKTPNGTVIQVRTSGFSKFADTVIPADVLNGSQKINITGVLCMYQGSIQLVINSLDDLRYAGSNALIYK